MPKPTDDSVAYALEISTEELKDQRALLKDAEQHGDVYREEIEERIEQLKRAIKYLKEYKEET